MRHPEIGILIPTNLAELGADTKEFEDILSRLDKYARERREVGLELQRHHAKLEAAKEADSRTYAEAIKAGKKSPPEEQHARKAEAERDAL